MLDAFERIRHRLQGMGAPVVDLRGKRPGKTLVVTGGVDGDEYAGMEAAFRLVDEYRSVDFAGRLVVIPVFNRSGFTAKTSRNPEDKRYPKLIFPGRPSGTASERLVYELYEKYLKGADFWYDAHGGSLDERLHPFLWTYETGDSQVDTFVQSLHATLGADLVLYEKAPWFSKARRLAKNGCGYLMAESGERGECLPMDVERHLAWMKGVMCRLDMVDLDDAKKIAPLVRRTLAYVVASDEGAWQVERFSSQSVHRHDSVGRWTPKYSFFNSAARDLRAPRTGTILWYTEASVVKQGDILCAIGY